MKKISTLVLASLLIALISFAPPSQDESIYSSKYIKYSVERDGSTAIVKVDVADIDQYDEIFLRRSNNPMNDFRQVKYLTKSKIGELASSGLIVDKYPLPGNIDTYYKVVAISNEGVYKLFPCVKLSRYK